MEEFEAEGWQDPETIAQFDRLLSVLDGWQREGSSRSDTADAMVIDDLHAPLDYAKPFSNPSEVDRYPSFVESQTRSSSQALSQVLSQALSQAKGQPNDQANGGLAAAQMQEILLGLQLAELHYEVADVQAQLEQVDQRVFERDRMMRFLLPLFIELLDRKVVESKEEVVRALTPIVEQVIQRRTEQDLLGMGAAIAPILPPAITQEIQAAPEEMAVAIAPMMGRALKKQVELSEDAVVDALYTILGKTVSKYLAETIQAINDKLEAALSPEGMQRKIRAKLQGVSEAELILKESMAFKVQAIFLIHKASGLIIAEAQSPDAQILESEMMAGMLTAIRSFANDCIAQAGSAVELDAIDYGMFKISLEVAGYCYLAVVSQGVPSKQFMQRLRCMLAQLVKDHGDAIEHFEGDAASVPAAVHTALHTLKESELGTSKSTAKSRNSLLVIGLVGLSVIGVPWGIWQYRVAIDRQAEAKTTAALTATPALSVYNLSAQVEQGQLKLLGRVPNQGLQQQAERVARSALPDWSIRNEIIAVEVPADPTVVAAEVERVTVLLNQLAGVAIATQYVPETAQVTITGAIDATTKTNSITQAFERIPGVNKISSAIQVAPAPLQIQFYFEPNSAQLQLGDAAKLQAVVQTLQRSPQLSLQIVGYSDQKGDAIANQDLALARAIAVRDALVQQGTDPERLQPSGLAIEPPGSEDLALWQKRSVMLYAVLSR